MKNIAWYKEILASDALVLKIVKDELTAIKDEYGDARRTRIIESSADISIEDLIEEEDMVVTISKSGYIKRNPITLYNSQKRGGKGKMAMGTKEDDFVEHLFVASTHHMFLFFTNMGKVYWSKVYELPMAGRTSKGRAIVNFLNFEKDEKLTTVLAVPSFESGKNIIMATKNGLVKKTDLMAYSRPRLGGIIAIDLVPGDELVAARISDGSMEVFLGSQKGKSIRFNESDVRTMGRVSRGVRGINLGKNDRIVSMEVLSHGQSLFAVTVNGYGKRTLIDEYPVRKRGGKGVISIKTTTRNGDVAAILLVEDADDLMLMTDTGKLIRMPIRSINVISRNTQGVRLINLEDKEKVVGAARLAEADDDDDDENKIPVTEPLMDQGALEPEDEGDEFEDEEDDSDDDLEEDDDSDEGDDSEE
jgi:DNA gyrase subunit A